MLKRFFNFGIITMIISASLFVTSCNDDDDPIEEIHLNPVITLTPAQDTIYIMAGDTLDFEMIVSADDDLISAKLTLQMGTNQQILMDSTLSGGQKFFDRNFSIIFSNDLDEGTVGTVSAFAATNYRSSILDRYIKVLPGISHYEGVTLQAQADGPSTVNNNLSFYSASTNERYTYTQADADEFAQMIDLVFIHHSIYKNTQTNAEMSFQSPNEPNLVTLWQEQLLIPFQYNADNKNTTYFKRLFGVNWDNLDNASIENTIDGIGTDTMIHDLNPEDYIGFMTHTGNYGIIRVTATNPEHNPYTDATITFDVKVQK